MIVPSSLPPLKDTKNAKKLRERYGTRDDWLPESQILDLLVYYDGLCKSSAGFCCRLTENWRMGEDFPKVVGDWELWNERRKAYDLDALTKLCREDCEAKKFVPEFHPILSEGIWLFRPQACPGPDCSGHGYCEMAQCVCEQNWLGADCSMPKCPGSACYTHPTSQRQTCTFCSQRGRCIRGKCECAAGWVGHDCAGVECANNCSSTPTEHRGTCVEDFPVSQCVCVGRFAGHDCSVNKCLHDCSGHGSCEEGRCECQPMYFGVDCSVFVFRITDGGGAGGASGMVAILVAICLSWSDSFG